MRTNPGERPFTVYLGVDLTLNGEVAPTPAKKERVFFRVPVRIHAKVSAAGGAEQAALIAEISTTGLSFYIKDDQGLPDAFNLSFRPADSLKTLTIPVAAMNRSKVRGQMLIGCRFLQMGDEEKQKINNYVMQLADFSLPIMMLGIAAFLLSLDALFRIFAYTAIIHYARAPFLKETAIAHSSLTYSVALALYALISFTALFFSEDMRKKGFIITFSSVAVIFLFVLIKHIIYWTLSFSQVRFVAFNPYAWVHFALLMYAGLALVTAGTSLKRVIAVSNAIREHQKAALQA